MKFIDLTYTLKNNIEVYPEDPKFKINSIKKGTPEDSCSLYEVKGGLHSGTHIDSPYHYILNGKKVNDLQIDSLTGKSTVLTVQNLENSKEIFIKDTDYKNTLEKIVIIKTAWADNLSKKNYFYENPYISIELAKLLVEKNVSGVAIDTCSVDKYGESKIHKLLLKNNIWIVENLANTNKLVKNSYESYFIPMKINAEASFVRAFVKK